MLASGRGLRNVSIQVIVTVVIRLSFNGIKKGIQIFHFKAKYQGSTPKSPRLRFASKF